MITSSDSPDNFCDAVIESLDSVCPFTTRYFARYQGPFALATVRVSVPIDRSSAVSRLVQVEVDSTLLMFKSTTLHVFTRPENNVPYFVLETVHRGTDCMLLCDLVPKTIGLNDCEDYSSLLKSLKASESSTFSDLKYLPLTKKQASLLSPAALVCLTKNEELFLGLESVVLRYLDRWVELFNSASAIADSCTRSRLIELDIRKRKMLFSPRTDRIWLLLWMLLGFKKAEEIRNLLIEDIGD